MKNYISNFLLIMFVLSTVACEKKADNSLDKAHKVHWDRDMCSRCVMVVSDRKNSAQVVDPKTNKKYMFDDIGCTILWFKEDKINWQESAIIWVTDVNTGKWIDARTAFYDTENITSMAYGFSAHETKDTIKKDQEIIDFIELSKRVIKIGK